MKISDMEMKGKYNLPVDQSKSNKDCYVVYAFDDEDNRHDFKIPKLKFQRKEQEDPENLDCIVKEIKNGIPVIGQDLSPIIARFYQKGVEYTFKVKDDQTVNGGFYTVEDDRGLYFRLYDKNRLFVGQSIKCKVLGINEVLVRLKLTSQKSRMNFLPRFISIETLINHVDHLSRQNNEWAIEQFKTNSLLAQAAHEHENQSPEWIFTTLRILNEKFTTFLCETDDYNEHLIPCLELAKGAALYILEGSDYLKQFGAEERPMRQKFLSDIVQDIKHYLQAIEIIKKGRQEQFLSAMLSNLQHSGYLYHPNKQFRIMMTLFKTEPKLVTQYMGKIFNALREWDIANWRNEPFRSAFVEQLEMFITTTRHRLDEMQSIESPEDTQIWSQMVKAIAIQILIANDKDGIDINRNRSMLYRYLSLTDSAGRKNLCHKALYSITTSETFPVEYNWLDTQQEILIKTKAADSIEGFDIDTNVIKTFVGNRCKVSISDEGVKLSALPEKSATTQVIPNGFFGWPNLKVMLPNGVNTPKAGKLKNIEALSVMWTDIERSLFAEAKKAKEIHKTIPEIGDHVYIHIDDVEITDEKTRLHCVIADSDDYYRGEGWMKIKDVVKYNVTPDINDFRHENGRLLTFEAKVLGRNLDDELSFTMNDMVNEIIKDSVHSRTTTSPGSISTCVITDKRNRQWSAISEEGYSLWIENGADYPDREVGDFVEVEVTHVQSMDKIDGEIIQEFARNSFPKTTPFQNLMCILSLDDDDDENVQLEQEALSSGQIIELIQLLRRLAVTEMEYQNSFNYLAFARLLALALEEKQLADNLHTHMQMLHLLKTYSDTKTIKDKDLEPFNHIEIDNTQPLLQRLYAKLRIVACVGDCSTESQSYLWKHINNAHNDFERQLAQMALSYNMLSINDLDEQREAIATKMRKMFNVNTFDTSAKFYGSESQTVEFKTSIVYPAGNHMRANIQEQTFILMKEICGFLNSTGGKIYLGVNDSGYAAGLYEDLKHDNFRNSHDKYMLHIYNSIANMMGKTAGQYVKVERDAESTDRDVYIITVKPCNIIIELDGKVFNRQGTSVRHLEGQDLEIFKENRAQQLREQKAVEDSNLAQEKSDATAATASEPAATTVTKPVATPSPMPLPQTDNDVVMTSLTRNNVLHDYEDGYLDVTNYIYFMKDDKYMHTSEDRWMDDDKSCRLSLAVHSDEESGQLVLIYEDGHVVKVNMREILEKGQDTLFAHNNEKKLLWACPSANADDYLLMVVSDNGGNLYYRANKLSEFENDSMKSFGSRLFETVIGDIVAADIVPASQISHFEKGSKCHWRQPGYTLKKLAGSEDGRQAIEDLLSPLKK